jgi:PAS domain S-box-containing protein
VSVAQFPEPPVEEDPAGDSLLERAERAEALYRSLVESLPAVTYAEALDDGRTLSIGPQAEDMFGYSEDEWMSDSLLWMKVIHPDDREWVIESCERANATGMPWTGEYRMIAKDGRVVWIRDEASLVRGSQGQPLCWQGVMWDITAQRTGGAPTTADSGERR